ncbi:hypothetical protein [Clostridium polynesiense]|uniref:hypothetical protein n=1 Tax=Clostridium polynesiense TaxID=1325933 RepID=UPI0006934561|nr:hypothetical protein [Clostridium polynesiense]
MIEYGRSIRWFNDYRDEIAFSDLHKFSFMQIWFMKGELLLDIAHIDDYNHLEKIIKVKFSKCIHIADKHFNVKHEHLPIGQGELDFEVVFNTCLKGYTGKIIFEVVDTDEEIIKFKSLIQRIFESR